MADSDTLIPERIAMLARNMPRYLYLSPHQPTKESLAPLLQVGWDRKQQMRIEELLREGPWTRARQAVLEPSVSFFPASSPASCPSTTTWATNGQWNGMNSHQPAVSYTPPPWFSEGVNPPTMFNGNCQSYDPSTGFFGLPYLPTLAQAETPKTESMNVSGSAVAPVRWTFMSNDGTIHGGAWTRRCLGPNSTETRMTEFLSARVEFGGGGSENCVAPPSRVPGVLVLPHGVSEATKNSNPGEHGSTTLNMTAPHIQLWTVLRQRYPELSATPSTLSVPQDFKNASASSTASARATQMISTLPHAQRWEIHETVRFPDVERSDWMFCLPHSHDDIEGSTDMCRASNGTPTNVDAIVESSRPAKTRRFLLSTLRVRPTSRCTASTEGEWYFWIYELAPLTPLSVEDNGGKVPPTYVFRDLNPQGADMDRFELKTRVWGWTDKNGVEVRFEYATESLSTFGRDVLNGDWKEEQRKRRELAVLHWVILSLKDQRFNVNGAPF